MRVPVVLTREEAERLLSRMGGAYRWMAGLLSGSGPRLMEWVRLRVKDVDLGYRQVTVRDGKGEKDHRTVPPESLAEPLGRHLEGVRLLRSGGNPLVLLSSAIERGEYDSDESGSGHIERVALLRFAFQHQAAEGGLLRRRECARR